jgi:hypothetical protein
MPVLVRLLNASRPSCQIVSVSGEPWSAIA